MAKKKILVGSKAFFSDIDGFRGHDTDYVEFVEPGGSLQWRKEISIRGVCIFTYVREPIGQMVQKTIESGDALLIGKFLVPEVAVELGAIVEDIMPLEVLLEKLDDRHKYISKIFSFVKANGSFTLTEQQRKEAFDNYAEYRGINVEEEIENRKHLENMRKAKAAAKEAMGTDLEEDQTVEESSQT